MHVLPNFITSFFFILILEIIRGVQVEEIRVCNSFIWVSSDQFLAIVPNHDLCCIDVLYLKFKILYTYATATFVLQVWPCMSTNSSRVR